MSAVDPAGEAPLPPLPSVPPPPPGERPVPPARKRRWLGTLIALLLVAGLCGLAWWLLHRPAATPVAGGPPGGGGPGGLGGPPGGMRGGPPTTVGTAVVRTQTLPVVIEALGTVTPRIVSTVRPQVSGVLTEVKFEEGQIVRKGDLLATIDPRPFEIALQQATGTRMRDEAQLEAARVTLERYRTLLGQDSIARQDVDTQVSTVKQLEATLVVDKASEATARLNLGYTRIVAPVAGRIGLRVVDVGNLVSSSDANGVAVITQLAPIDVEFAIPQDRLPELQQRVVRDRATLPVTVSDRTRTRQIGEGVFTTVDNQIDTTTGTVKAKSRFANERFEMFPNQFVNVRLVLDSVQNALVVPVTALRQGTNGPFVFVLGEDRTVSVRNVTRGISTNEVVQLKDGVKAGERVVTEGADRLRDGSRVQLAGDAPMAGASGAAGRGARGARAASGASGPRPGSPPSSSGRGPG